MFEVGDMVLVQGYDKPTEVVGVWTFDDSQDVVFLVRQPFESPWSNASMTVRAPSLTKVS